MAWNGLRFPNPSADIPRMINSFTVVHRSVPFGTAFGMDHIVTQLAQNHLAGSSGAAGGTAIARSYNRDRSRDALYNQAKMYSEIWRMLGLLHPTETRLEFTSTILARSLIDDAADAPDCQWGLIRESLLGLTFPNPNVHQSGVLAHRPFAWTLCLMQRLGGWLNREEMIVGVLAVTDDRTPGALDAAVAIIEQCREERAVQTEVERLAIDGSVQVNTLGNYTRFPTGVLRDPKIGWGERDVVNTPYKKGDVVTRLLPEGERTAESIGHLRDIRAADTDALQPSERAALALLGHYLGLHRAGFAGTDMDAALAEADALAGRALDRLGVPSASDLLFGPWQQFDRSTLDDAAALIAS